MIVDIFNCEQIEQNAMEFLSPTKKETVCMKVFFHVEIA